MSSNVRQSHRRRRVFPLIVLLPLLGASVSCARLQRGLIEPPAGASDRLDADLERAEVPLEVDAALDDALAAPDTVKRVASELIQSQLGEIAQAEILHRLEEERETMPTVGVRAAVELYLLLPSPDAPELFRTLIKGRRMTVRRTAWQVAAGYESVLMGEAVSRELSRRAALSDGSGMSPEAALAARANGLKDAYPLIRRSLMEEGQVAYAKALIDLNPEAAPDDLLAFLASIPPKAIADDKLKKVQRTTSLVALRFFAERSPSLHHPSLRRLFDFAGAADAQLAATAVGVLTPLVAARPEHFAFLLAQLPPPTQAAFLGRLEEADKEGFGKFRDTLKAVSVPDAT